MKASERQIKKIMKAEDCNRTKAERLYELSQMLVSDSFTPELGKSIYAELRVLRAR